MGNWKYREVYKVPMRECYFFWRGAASDLAYEITQQHGHVLEEVLLHKEGCDLSKVQHVYRYFEDDFIFDVFVKTPLFPSKKDLRAYMKENKIKETDDGSILEYEFSTYKPSVPEEPIVYIQRNKKGAGFCTYISRNVEEYGRYGRKKVFFPDKTWTDVREGQARVKITRELDSYGFITGEMLIPQPVSEGSALDFFEKLEDSVCNSETVICNFLDESTGEVAWGYAFNDSYCATVVTDAVSGKITALNNTMEQVKRTLIWSGPLYCALVRYDWGINEQELENILNSLTPSQHYLSYLDGKHAVADCNWDNCSDPDFIDPLVDEAFDAGIIKCFYAKRIPDIQIYCLRPKGFRNLSKFSREEITEILRLCNKANESADTKISGLMKKGILHPKRGWGSMPTNT